MALFSLKTFFLLFFITETVKVCVAHSHSHSHEENHGHSHDHGTPAHFKYSKEANEAYDSAPTKNESPGGLSQSSPWQQALLSTLLISIAPFVILFFIPIDNTESSKPLLKVLSAFAAGGLLGDAFLHLIPHAASGKEHSHSHSHEHSHDMSVGIWVLAGIVTFLIVEKGVRMMKGGHTHSHSHIASSNKKKDNDMKSDKKTNKGEKKNVEKIDTTHKEIKVAGYLNLAADFCHNFTDGLAIGSTFSLGAGGVTTTAAILLHEIPHEIGDFAILLQSGVSRRNAMLLQLVTAFGAFAGTILALLTTNSRILFDTDWILPFTAGGFIYIALVSVIPELLDEEKPSVLQTLLQVGALFVGVYMMVLISEFE